MLGIKQKSIEVKGIRLLTDSTYILELARNNIQFKAGQYVFLGLNEVSSLREYSIYSGENDDKLEVLIKVIDDGLISQKLKECTINQSILFDGPFGEFTLNQQDIHIKKYFFIASGTGIAPFHSYIRSYPMNYKLLHGVRDFEEAYEKEHYNPGAYILCTSKDERGHFHGRVTDYLRQNPPTEEYEYYLCGNGKMIYEAADILRNQLVPPERIHYEIYF